MTVRTQLGWPVRAVVGGVLLAVIAGMWWWGFDFGQIFGGIHRNQMAERVTTLEADNTRLAAEAGELRKRSMALESDAAITVGAQASLARQNQDLMAENAQVKEELAFLQKLVSDSSKDSGLAIQRLTFEHDHDDLWRYTLLIVRGGSPRDEFAGHVVLQAVVSTTSDGAAPRQDTLTLPSDATPPGAAALGLKFKYYQRLEGTLPLPPGAKPVSITVRAYEEGTSTPRATRTLTNPH